MTTAAAAKQLQRAKTDPEPRDQLPDVSIRIMAGM
jgi:hypothetical protein